MGLGPSLAALGMGWVLATLNEFLPEGIKGHILPLLGSFSLTWCPRPQFRKPQSIGSLGEQAATYRQALRGSQAQSLLGTERPRSTQAARATLILGAARKMQVRGRGSGGPRDETRHPVAGKWGVGGRGEAAAATRKQTSEHGRTRG